MGFAGAGTRDRKVAKPAAEPSGGCGRLQDGAGIQRLIECLDKIPKFISVDHLSSEMRIHNRDSTTGFISDRDQKTSRDVHAEDIEADTLGGGAVHERARNRQAGYSVQHEVQVHSIRMHRDILVTADSQVFEDHLVQMSHEGFRSTGGRGISSAGEVRDSGSNPVRDCFQASVGGVGIEFRPAVAAQGDLVVQSVIQIFFPERRRFAGTIGRFNARTARLVDEMVKTRPK